MKNFDYVIMMVMQANILHEKSYNVLCVEDEYERYILTADWYEGAPVLYISYDNVQGDEYIYYEAKEVNKQEIISLLDVWNDVASSFGYIVRFNIEE